MLWAQSCVEHCPERLPLTAHAQATPGPALTLHMKPADPGPRPEVLPKGHLFPADSGAPGVNAAGQAATLDCAGAEGTRAWGLRGSKSHPSVLVADGFGPA